MIWFRLKPESRPNCRFILCLCELTIVILMLNTLDETITVFLECSRRVIANKCYCDLINHSLQFILRSPVGSLCTQSPRILRASSAFLRILRINTFCILLLCMVWSPHVKTNANIDIIHVLQSVLEVIGRWHLGNPPKLGGRIRIVMLSWNGPGHRNLVVIGSVVS